MIEKKNCIITNAVTTLAKVRKRALIKIVIISVCNTITVTENMYKETELVKAS
ncbi:MAG: hypothetical protein J7L47_09795 [Candidatus Odinarchaeota archaeon]|nr:hypothetical protein [Candidatus Odinarchaeota archaeon]